MYFDVIDNMIMNHKLKKKTIYINQTKADIYVQLRLKQTFFYFRNEQ